MASFKNLSKALRERWISGQPTKQLLSGGGKMCDYEEETIATTRGSKNGIGTEAKNASLIS